MVFTPDYPGDYSVEVVISQYGDEISNQTFAFLIMDPSERDAVSDEDSDEPENEDWLNEEMDEEIDDDENEDLDEEDEDIDDDDLDFVFGSFAHVGTFAPPDLSSSSSGSSGTSGSFNSV